MCNCNLLALTGYKSFKDARTCLIYVVYLSSLFSNSEVTIERNRHYCWALAAFDTCNSSFAPPLLFFAVSCFHDPMKNHMCNHKNLIQLLSPSAQFAHQENEQHIFHRIQWRYRQKALKIDEQRIATNPDYLLKEVPTFVSINVNSLLEDMNCNAVVGVKSGGRQVPIFPSNCTKNPTD
ncbi:unnamed protein product [Lactuca saligna]|uniref:Uncharacterized protein n=1 Tax=Lactuca saligna TaxID=75948 RepID=A0AA35Z5H4_LACSI|nr:unnamed protein product [Lactuca saligna]